MAKRRWCWLDSAFFLPFWEDCCKLWATIVKNGDHEAKCAKISARKLENIDHRCQSKVFCVSEILCRECRLESLESEWRGSSFHSMISASNCSRSCRHLRNEKLPGSLPEISPTWYVSCLLLCFVRIQPSTFERVRACHARQACKNSQHHEVLKIARLFYQLQRAKSPFSLM